LVAALPDAEFNTPHFGEAMSMNRSSGRVPAALRLAPNRGRVLGNLASAEVTQ